MIGHTASVSSLSMDPSGIYLFSGSHDGSLRAWDVRNYKCLCEIPSHRRKYEESVNVVLKHPNLPLLATGGADSLIKVLNATNFRGVD
jgi:striatin 1/3/4